MAIAIMQDFVGGTQVQYDLVLVQLDLGGHSPQGNLYHTAGPIEGGWRVVDVWESQEAFNAFVGVLAPVAQSIGMPQPQVTVWPIYNILTPKS
jgi:hypothetical protein